MNAKKGFTLVELMVVVLIVGILAAVAIPMMQGRIDQAKWSEAKASCGTIATAVRTYTAEGKTITGSTTLTNLGFAADDLDGTYFAQKDYTFGTVTDGKNFTLKVTSSLGGPTGTMTMTVSSGAASFDK